MNAGILGSLMRHGAGAIGMLIAQQGWADEATGTAVGGAVLTIGSFLYSIAEKKQR